MLGVEKKLKSKKRKRIFSILKIKIVKQDEKVLDNRNVFESSNDSVQPSVVFLYISLQQHLFILHMILCHQTFLSLYITQKPYQIAIK